MKLRKESERRWEIKNLLYVEETGVRAKATQDLQNIVNEFEIRRLIQIRVKCWFPRRIKAKI